MEKSNFLLSFWKSPDCQSYEQFVFSDLDEALLFFVKACQLNFMHVDVKQVSANDFYQVSSLSLVVRLFESYQFNNLNK